MRYDVVIVSYNSMRWLPNCIAALAELDYDKSALNVIIVDNHSSDQTPQCVCELQDKYDVFGGFTLLEQPKNYGFGKGCNIGAREGHAPFIFMLNVDTEIELDAIKEMDLAITRDEKGEAGAFEMRQKPVEVGRHNDPITMECSWNSGACVVYRREIFEQLGGFDENMFMYCEDVDLSWRIRAAGYRLIYVPRAAVHHYTRRGDVDKEFHEYIWTAYNKLMMHYKYGDFKSRCQGRRDYINTIKHPRHYNYVRRILLKNYIRHFFNSWPFFKWRFDNRVLMKNIPATYIEGFEVMRSLYEYVPLKQQPLVSVIVRTCSRPEVLRLTLQALRHQTYSHFEIVIQEDGEATAQKMVETEFCDLDIRYEATGTKVGRSKAGNRALARARGEYINFLDDDDFFYPEHIELMLSTFEQNPEADIVLNGYMIYRQNTYSTQPYKYEVINREYHVPERVDILAMSKRDQIPILTAMFKRHLYDKMGGLREDIDTNEDWGMWLRFFTLKPICVTNDRATTAFVFPADKTIATNRILSYRENYQKVFDDEDLVYQLSAKELNTIYNNYMADMKHLSDKGVLDEYLDENLAY